MNIIKSVYDVYLYKIVKYYYPIIEQYAFNKNKHKIKKYNNLKIYRNIENIEFVYKIANIEYNPLTNTYYNLGSVYHTSNYYNINNLNKLFENIIDISIDIDLIKFNLMSVKSKKLYTLIDTNFINTILVYSTKESNLESLLYYYLNRYLSINDKIISIEFEINNKLIKINLNQILEDLFEKTLIN